MISPRLTPDQAAVGRLVTEARTLAQELGGVERAAAALEALGEERTDLLTQAAGTILHNFFADPLSAHPNNLMAVSLLLRAGADTEELRHRAT